MRNALIKELDALYEKQNKGDERSIQNGKVEYNQRRIISQNQIVKSLGYSVFMPVDNKVEIKLNAVIYTINTNNEVIGEIYLKHNMDDVISESFQFLGKASHIYFVGVGNSDPEVFKFIWNKMEAFINHEDTK